MSADLKRLLGERQANETLVAIGKFSAALAHDLRNPVEGLKLLSSELKKRVEQTQSAHEVAETISQSVYNLSSLVNQSLDFARLNQPKFSPTNLAALANEMLADFNFAGIELKRDYADDLPDVEVDAVQIKRVLANLLTNALDACRARKEQEKKKIFLTLKSQGEKISIEVRDSGAGIPLEDREKIFDPFFTTKPGGHGLGLASARQIVSNHGGAITVTSESGRGTRFVIKLPVAQT